MIWYDPQKTLDHGCLFNFVVGNRGCGKTYGCKKLAIKRFLKTGEQFVYLRRNKTEFKNGRKFFDDIAEEFIGHEFSVTNNGEYMIDKKVAGYQLTLSTAKISKSVSFPKVWLIIFDEFIIDKGYYHYLPNEVTDFLELYETVARMRDVTVMFLSNAVTFVNPYFLYFKLDMPKNGRISKKDDILLEVYKNTEFIEKKKQTRFGKIISGTDYGRYNIENTFLRDTSSFIKKMTEPCRPLYNIVWAGKTYAIWVNNDYTSLYVLEDECASDFTYALTTSDYTENNMYFSSFKDSRNYRLTKAAFESGVLFFTTQNCKTAMYEMLSKIMR